MDEHKTQRAIDERGESAYRLAPAARRRQRREIESSYRELFTCWVVRLRRKYGLSNDDAKDVVQEALALLMAAIRKKRIHNLRAWIGGTTDRLALDQLRTAGRRAAILVRYGPIRELDRNEPEETSDES